MSPDGGRAAIILLSGFNRRARTVVKALEHDSCRPNDGLSAPSCLSDPSSPHYAPIQTSPKRRDRDIATAEGAAVGGSGHRIGYNDVAGQPSARPLIGCLLPGPPGAPSDLHRPCRSHRLDRSGARIFSELAGSVLIAMENGTIGT
ncbi:hypothetical protein N7532_000838 [Penicillium argentinense]|uniref:Uncharacterized protein n=1 Tax=Penicillium argentinense TaxID=1131581 RepID=A0A9W9G645_9EURO|nr:uncharacterized protein N7532_000838 [Penicillium argentinense]KAJ5112793.1 hypothetical protein N7532_000838 [Penicillium argentinense]